MTAIDPDGALGVTDDSIHVYYMGSVSRAIGNALLPPTTPYQALDGATEMSVLLKGNMLSHHLLVYMYLCDILGTPQDSCDALAYCLLVSTSQLQSYIAMLLEVSYYYKIQYMILSLFACIDTVDCCHGNQRDL